jgi:hypothetical protein
MAHDDAVTGAPEEATRLRLMNKTTPGLARSSVSTRGRFADLAGLAGGWPNRRNAVMSNMRILPAVENQNVQELQTDRASIQHFRTPRRYYGGDAWRVPKLGRASDVDRRGPVPEILVPLLGEIKIPACRAWRVD